MAIKYQSAQAVLMVRPVEFGYNEETAKDNEFQNKIEVTEELRKKVLGEFDEMVNKIRAKGIEVLVLDYTVGDLGQPTPDAVFPNNWFMTDQNGNVYTFPLKANNRRLEKKRLNRIMKLLKDNNFQYHDMIDIGNITNDTKFLEGTGSMVIDHINDIIYASISPRTDFDILMNFNEFFNHNTIIAFESNSSNGLPVYHTNVVLAICSDFVVICTDSIKDKEQKEMILKTIGKDRVILDISNDSMEKNFSGNILEVRSKEGKKYIIMSDSAYKGFSPKQIEVIFKYAQIITVDIKIIETIGGGSARCMMAEIFLPKN